MASGGADRIEQDLTWDDVSAPMLDVDEDGAAEDALLAYAQRKAARTGAEWFAAEWRRRDEQDERDRAPAPESGAASLSTLRPLPARDEGVVDAAVEANVVVEGPARLDLRPEPSVPVVAAASPVPEPEHVNAPAPVAVADTAATPTPAPAPIAVAPQPATPAPAAAPAAAAPAAAAPAAAAPLLPAVVAAMAPVTTPAPEVEAAALKHPHVPRPPVVEEPEPQNRKERRRRKRDLEETPAATQPIITAAEWAHMSPGARRLYGMENAPPS